jgi:heme exporter protein CcmD
MGIDWALFWNMGGHGAFVWPAYGFGALALLVESVLLRRRWQRSRRDALEAPR